MSAPRSRRVAFFTIGESPRSDVVPEMAPVSYTHLTLPTKA